MSVTPNIGSTNVSTVKIKPRRQGRRQSSVVWEYFSNPVSDDTVPGSHYTICRFCKEKLSYNQSSLLMLILQAAARHLVQHFRRSTKSMSALRNRYSQYRLEGQSTSIEMPIDVATRWNSTYVMLDNLTKHQWTIRSVLSDPAVIPRKTSCHLDIKDDHWDLMKELVIILKNFKAASDHLEGSHYVTVCSLIPLVKGLVTCCQNLHSEELTISVSKTFCNTLLESLEKRFSYVLTTSAQQNEACVTLFHKATWLHPDHKGKFFDRQFRVLVRVALETEGEDSVDDQHDHRPATTGSCNASSDVDLVQGLFKLGKETSGSSSESETSSNNISGEISWFMHEKVGVQHSPLVWWHAHKQSAPALYNLATKYLGVPATSAASERSFSSAGLTVSQLRTRLTGTHVNELNFLHCNKTLLD